MTDKPKKTVTKFLYDKNNYPAFKILIEQTEYKDTSFNAEVYSVNGWEADGSKTPVDLELYLSCYIKWDSCSHFNFGEENKEGNSDGYLHICGAEYYKQHVDLMNYLYHLAFEQMGIEPYDEAENWELDMKVLNTGVTNA